jgi:DNA-binding NarL/FixJ family response regulator
VASVYLIFENRLFRDAVAAVLATNPEIRLLGAANRPDVAAAEIACAGPDVILLEESSVGPFMADVQRILTSPAACRLITLRMDGDGMHVWSGTWQQAAGPRELVQAITCGGEEAG